MIDGGVQLFDRIMKNFAQYWELTGMDPNIHLEHCRIAANAGHKDARYIVNKVDESRLQNFHGVIQFEDFFRLFEADQDHPIALFLVWCCSFDMASRENAGVHNRDLSGGAALKKSAELGFSYAQLEYGKQVQSSKWIKLAANQNNGVALYTLGRLYDKGWYGDKVDIDAALVYYERAALLGNINGMNRCKWLYQRACIHNPILHNHDKFIYWSCRLIELDAYCPTDIFSDFQNRFNLFKDYIMMDKFLLGEALHKARTTLPDDSHAKICSLSAETEKMISIFKESTNAAYAAVIYFLLISKKHSHFPRDVTLLIAKMVWESRRDPERNGWCAPTTSIDKKIKL